MKLHRQIKALLFLTIISLFTAHNALPHAHHSSTSHVEDHKHAEHHHHSHGHSHDNVPQDPSENTGAFLLDVLLDTHAHSSHTHVYFTLADAVSKINKISVTLFDAEITSRKFLLPLNEPDGQRRALYGNVYYDDPSLHYCPLRAPPFLGS